MPVTGSGGLATFLDREWLVGRGVTLYAEVTPDSAMPVRAGSSVAAELGGRFLLSYLRRQDVLKRSRSGAVMMGAATWCVYTTPTPYAPREVISALALPLVGLPRTHVLVLDPAHIVSIQGPRRVSCGYGIEYLLPFGYPASALKLPWEKVID